MHSSGGLAGRPFNASPGLLWLMAEEIYWTDSTLFSSETVRPHRNNAASHNIKRFGRVQHLPFTSIMIQVRQAAEKENVRHMNINKHTVYNIMYIHIHVYLLLQMNYILIFFLVLIDQLLSKSLTCWYV